MNTSCSQPVRDGKIRLKVKKKRKSFASMPLKSIDNIQSSNPRTGGRLNPFSTVVDDGRVQPAPKRARVCSGLFNALETKENGVACILAVRENFPNSEDVPVHRGDLFATNPNVAATETHSTTYSGEHVPLDWSMKTKARVVTSSSMSWCCTLKSSQEAAGVTSYVRCTGKETTIEPRSSLQACLLNWVYPNIPWIPNFPDFSSKQEKNTTRTLTNPSDVSLLWKSWCQSFKSIFNLTKSGFCPYFYLHSHNMVGLFTSAAVSTDESAVVITPTTKGFRTMLQNEGINFAMPFMQHTMPDYNKENNDEEDDDVPHDTGGHHEDEFLESIGLQKEQFPSIEARRKQGERVKLRAIDQRQQSTIVVPRSDLLAVFNFFLNANVLIATAGPSQGVPPTLHSPIAFEGAALKQAKVVVRKIKQKRRGAIETVNSVEISGLLLPLQIHSICKLFQEQNTAFTMHMTTHQLSSPLNAIVTQQQQPHTDNICENLGISKQDCDHLTQSTIDRVSIHRLEVDGSIISHVRVSQ